ncbi:hypothetical protein [Nocardia sp. NPDC057227]|uniref:hypothetical protein n=1 Tax=Nocardia sp. NPDC057227 TaxID=3346056 RepID=UPI00362D5F9A
MTDPKTAAERSFIALGTQTFSEDDVDVRMFDGVFVLELHRLIHVHLAPADFKALVAKMADALDAVAEKAKK